jgi:hypothetical protein
MMHRLLFLLFFICGGLLRAQAPDPVFQGMWLGKLIQNRTAPFNEYRFRMHIGQRGNRLFGTTHLSMLDSMEIFAEIEFKGFAGDEVMTFQETRINRSHEYGDNQFCIKNGTLRVSEKGGLYRLEGDWEGRIGPNPCTPGRIILEKLNPNPPPPPADTTEDPEFKSYGSLDGRNIDRQRDVEVNRKTLTVYVWDADKVDGDVISLSFNGKWLLRNYPIKKEKHAIEIVLDDNADNRLILYAENEGKFPPNTAALTFFDGKKQRNLNLMSTKSTCGAIRFIARD